MTIVKLMRSAVIEAPVGEVWALLRDFNGHDAWHPAVASSTIEAGEPGDMVGAIRAFRLKDGGFLREQLIALSDRDMSLSYCLIEAPIPLHDYVARMQLRPITDGDHCFLQWESSFRPPEAQAAALAHLVAVGIYEAGIQALQAHFGGGSPRNPSSEIVVARTDDGLRTASPAQNAAPGDEITAQVILIEAYGGPEVLTPRQVSVLAPGPGEVRLRQTAVGVNFIDLHCRAGEFDLLRLPGVPGVEAAGVVMDIGAGVAHLRPGDRVVYAGLPLGAYAACRTLPAGHVVILPQDIEDRTAAAIFLKGLLADALLHDVHHVHPGEFVLIRAAAGGVGLLLCQMAKAMGALVIGAISDERKASAVRDAGCDHVVVTGREDVVASVLAVTDGRGADVVFDGIGQESYESSLQALATRGHLVSYGQSSGPVGPRQIDDLAVKSIRLSRPNLAHFTQERPEIERRATRLFDFLRQGSIRPQFSTLGLAEAAKAHRLLADRANIGAIVLIP